MRSDAFRRGLRTFMDIAFVEAVIQLAIAFGVDLTEEQHAAILVIAPFFVSAFKNSLEDSGAIPALLKAPPSPGENPIPDPEPDVSPVRAALSKKPPLPPRRVAPAKKKPAKAVKKTAKKTAKKKP